MANMTLKDIHAVELLGGSVRMPVVKSRLESYFKAGDLELGQHLNGDEAMALGATFRGANISTAFRVRKVGVHDLSTFGVSVKFDNLPTEPGSGLFSWLMGSSKESKETADAEAWSKHTSLYPGGSPVPSKTKTVAFHHDQNILCRLEYDNDPSWPLPVGASPLFGVFNITGITEFAKETASLGAGQPKVHLSFTLDGSGMVILTKAEATLELATNSSEETPSTTDETSKDAEDTPAAEADAKTDSTDTEDKETAADSGEEESTTPDKTSEKKEEKKEEKTSGKKDKKEKKEEKKSSKKTSGKKDNTLRKTLTVSWNYDAVSPPIWSPELILEAKGRLRTLDQADAARKEKAAALNDLEAYVYKIRNRIRDEEDKFAVISTAEQRETLVELCNEIEEWLYDDGRHAELSDYKTKQSSIKSKAEAIFKVSLSLTLRDSPHCTSLTEIERTHCPS
jgi:hypoxia up-regulated 1